MMSEKGTWTEPQRKLLFSLMEKNSLTKEDMEDSLKFPMSELSLQEASGLIDCLKNNGDLSLVIGKIRDMHPGPDQQEEKQMAKPAEVIEKPQAKQAFTVQPGSELALAKTAGIPEEMANLFFMKLNGNAYIKVAGLQYMAGKIGYRRIEIIDNFDEKSGTWTAEAKIYPKIDNKTLEALSKLSPETQKMAYEDLSKPTNGIGTASKENVQNRNMHQFLREMAQTRALGRALRSYTGYGSTTYEELPNAEIRED